MRFEIPQASKLADRKKTENFSKKPQIENFKILPGRMFYLQKTCSETHSTALNQNSKQLLSKKNVRKNFEL